MTTMRCRWLNTPYISPSKYGYFGYLYSIAGGICLSIWQMCTHEFSIYNILLSFICICICLYSWFCKIPDIVSKNKNERPPFLSLLHPIWSFDLQATTTNMFKRNFTWLSPPSHNHGSEKWVPRISTHLYLPFKDIHVSLPWLLEKE